jgi:hypothetical protein
MVILRILIPETNNNINRKDLFDESKDDSLLPSSSSHEEGWW